MSRRPQLSRQVPADSVQEFDDWCEREGHINGGDKGRIAEQAIIEYLPPEYRPDRFQDDLDEVERDLRADLDELGLLSDGSSSNRSLSSIPSDETTKLTYRIAEDAQDALERYVYDQEKKVRGVVGEYIAAALDEYRDGGQAARVRRYYEQLREDVDMVSDDRIQPIVETMRNEWEDRESYHIKEIKGAVDDALDVHSEDVRNDFADRVIDRLGLVSVKSGDGVYASPDRAEQLVQQLEVDINTDWYLMDKEDRIEHLMQAVKARSRQSGKGCGVNYNQVRDEIFNELPSNDYCYELMELAGEYPGFEYGSENGNLMLKYIGREDRLSSEPAEDWQNKAVELLKEFCDNRGIAPTELSKPIIDNRIARTKYPEAYVDSEDAVGTGADDVGPSERALETITEGERENIRSYLVNETSQTKTKASEEMDRITTESEPVTDGGQSDK